MPKCSSSIQVQSNNRVDSCSCNLFSNNSLSMVFPTTPPHSAFDDEPITSSSPVDCTLSLGTPATRQTSCNGDVKKSVGNNNNSFMSNLCWSAFQTSSKKPISPSAPPPTTGGCINNNNISNGDQLLVRRCANCETTSTPLWRNGPRGPKSLCNACGIRYKKEERRATTPQTNSGASATGTAPQPPHLMSHPASWSHHHPGPQKVLGNEFRFMEAAAGETTNSFLSWRLNVPDHRASLVHGP